MAKALAFSPQLQNFKNQILGSGIIRRWSSIFDESPNKFCINRNVENVPHAGGFASVSLTSLPFVPDSAHPLRSRRRCLGFSSLSLLPLRRSHSSRLQFFLMSSTNPPQQSAKTVKCVIKGRVQGVFYRNWTVENATELGLKGWVRNRRDGSVEALFSGNPEAVDAMLQRCRRGPPDAMVTAFEAAPCNDDPGTGFQRKPTV